MSSPSTPADSPVAPRGPSTRGRLARLALDAAVGADGVVAGHGGPGGAHVSVAEGGRAVGVVAAARPDGRYDVALSLVARPVDLHALAAEVRTRVAGAASSAGLTDALGQVDVGFEDVLEVLPPDPPAGG